MEKSNGYDDKSKTIAIEIDIKINLCYNYIMPKCIKCLRSYEDSEPDDYYCSDCLIVKKKLAEEINKRMASRPKRNVVSDLKRYDELKGNSPFINAKYL